MKDLGVCIVELNTISELLMIYHKYCCLKSEKGQAWIKQIPTCRFRGGEKKKKEDSVKFMLTMLENIFSFSSKGNLIQKIYVLKELLSYFLKEYNLM